MTEIKYAVSPGKSNQSPKALNRLWVRSREDRERAMRLAQHDSDLALGKYVEFLKRQKKQASTQIVKV